MSYVERLTATDTEATFELEGSHLLLFKHNGGTWALSILTPDDEEIAVTAITGDTQQALAHLPEGTRIKLSGGTVGAKAWTGKVKREVGDFL
ncbi:MAG: hypothetical protein OXM61_16780 [Candidatus Poribacteria bacterium]|nr:hypothetical protein [Candidatus Poribacteria bacterium]